ncbi:MAG: PaaI family thioesterase [Deltaproteobacteria bacterium]|nr:PaaI family thioesterase [Deltaproteobacteria bacterium]
MPPRHQNIGAGPFGGRPFLRGTATTDTAVLTEGESVQSLKPSDEARIRRLFFQAPFICALEIRLDRLGPGWCETSMHAAATHRQQDGFIHAGVVSTLADHTGGGAGWTRTVEGQTVLSVEFKISLLRPARADRLRCRAEVVRAGRTLIFTEATVYAGEPGDEKAVARLSQTLAVVDAAVGAATPIP